MTYMPIENFSDDTVLNTEEADSIEKDNSYGYNDNLTAKLGGNYSKIIEFYEDRL